MKNADTIINTGIEQIERITPKIEKLIEKSTNDVTSLRDEASVSGSSIALNAEINILNQLNTIKARISRYSNLIRDNSQGLDKRVAFVSVVVPLIETVDDIARLKG